jgi:choline dehydrogenase
VRETFDYIVVGAGSAGSVVAGRLTENPDVRVLLLEAGGEDDADEIHIPAAFANLFKTKWDWNYETVEQKHMGDRTSYWPRMKALGGCSSMNAMIYIRGNPADYNAWRDEHGATGWGWDDVLPYFVRAEHNTRLGGPLHGTEGPLFVEDRRYTHDLSRAWVEAAVAWGLKPTDDFNGTEQEGAGQYQVTCHNGRRWSTADAYLRPAMTRPNLTVRTHALVTKVVVESGRAVGVSYLHEGTSKTTYVDGEVVLSGGAVNSPQLLMLSGIGPAAHLRELGIDVVAGIDQVGENLHDHPAAGVIWTTKKTTDLVDYANPRRLVQWQLTGRGPMASNVGEAGAFLHAKEGLPAPDLQFVVAPTLFYDNGMHEPTARGFTSAATLIAPKSRGRLRLRSTNPEWRPAIDPAYYSDQSDMDTMVRAMRLLMEIGERPALARYLDKPFKPGKLGLTDDEVAEHVRENTQTLYHPVGTCSIGTVVDSSLKVNGVEGLRVADASVMPIVPRGNTNAPTIMVGEKAADLLRNPS